MKIAIPYQNGNVFQHFGKSEFFKIYEISGKLINSSEVIPTNGAGHSALADFLAGQKVDTVICGGIGQGAINALSSYHITVVGGASGNTDEVVNAFVNGTLITGDATCGCDKGC